MGRLIWGRVEGVSNKQQEGYKMRLQDLEQKLGELVGSGRSLRGSQGEFDSLLQRLSCFYGEQIGLGYLRKLVGAGYDRKGKGDKISQRLDRYIRRSTQVYKDTDKTRSLYQSVTRDRGVRLSHSRVLKFRQNRKGRKHHSIESNGSLEEILGERRLREELELEIENARRTYEEDPEGFERRNALTRHSKKAERKYARILARKLFKAPRLVSKIGKRLSEIPIIGERTALTALGEFRENLEEIGEIILDRPSIWMPQALARGFKTDRIFSIGLKSLETSRENLDLSEPELTNPEETRE